MLDKTKVSKSATALLVAYAISLPVAQLQQTNANEKQQNISAEGHSKTDKKTPKPKHTHKPKPKKTAKPLKTETSKPVVKASSRPKHTSRSKSSFVQPKVNANVARNQAFAKSYMAEKYGWTGEQVGCLINLWTRESGWRETAHNPSSGAHGIPQSLPGSKMASVGADWYSNPETQIKWGLKYIDGRYGTPCGAMSFWYNHNWY